MCSKSEKYHQWHHHKHHKTVHIGVVVLTFLIAGTLIYSVFPHRAKAASSFLAAWDDGHIDADQALGSKTATNNGTTLTTDNGGFGATGEALKIRPKQNVRFDTKNNIDLSRSLIESNFNLDYPLYGNDITSFNLNNSGQIALDGTVAYVADSGNNRIIRMNWNGSTWDPDSWDAFGQFGAGVGQFNNPTSIAFDTTDDVAYVGDSGNCRVVRMHWNGNGWDSWNSYGYCGADQEQFNTNGYTPFSSFTLDTTDAVKPALLLGDYGRIIRIVWDEANSEWINWTEYTADDTHLLKNIKSIAWNSADSMMYVVNGTPIGETAMAYYVYPIHWNSGSSSWDTWHTPVMLFDSPDVNKPAELAIDTVGDFLYASVPGALYKFSISTASAPALQANYPLSTLTGGVAFSNIEGMAFDSAAADIYIIDTGNVEPITRAHRTGATSWNDYSDNGTNKSIPMSFTPVDVAYDSANSVIFVAESSRIVALHLTNGMIDRWYSYGCPGGTDEISYDSTNSALYIFTAPGDYTNKIKRLVWSYASFSFTSEYVYEDLNNSYMFMSETTSFTFDTTSQSVYIGVSSCMDSGWNGIGVSLFKLKWNGSILTSLEYRDLWEVTSIQAIATSNDASKNLYIKDADSIRIIHWETDDTLDEYTGTDVAYMIDGDLFTATDIVYSSSEDAIYGIDPGAYHVVRLAKDGNHFNAPSVYGQRGSVDDYGAGRFKEGLFGLLKGMALSSDGDVYLADSICKRAVKVKWVTSEFTNWATFADPYHYVMTTTGQYPLRIRFNIMTSRLEFFLSYGSKEVFVQSDKLTLSAGTWYKFRVKYDSSTGQYSLIVYNYPSGEGAAATAISTKEITTVGSWTAPTTLGANFYLGSDKNANYDQRSLGGYLDNFSIESLAPPPVPTGLGVVPINYSGEKNFTFTWTAGTGDYSGDVEAFEYQINDDGWQDNAMNLTYTLNETNNPNTELNEGPNVFTVRARGKNDNYSPETAVTFYYSQNTATAPQNLVVTPASSGVGTSPGPATDNSFTANYTHPEVMGGAESDVVYYYSVDSRPTGTGNTRSTSPNQLQITGIKATVQASIGPSILYIVSKGSNGIVDWDACDEDPAHPGDLTYVLKPNYCAKALMYVTTAAPSFPTEVKVKDTSNKDKDIYEAVMRWDASTHEGSGNLSYEVCRSSDNIDFSSCWETAVTYFYQTDLTKNAKYYYKVRAFDDAHSYSEFSETKDVTVTGDFTSPPILKENSLTVEPKSTSATIRWSTEDEELKNVHKASSFVEYGTSESTMGKANGGFEKGEQAYVDDHEVVITGLEPDKTKYYFKIVWYDENGNKGYYQQTDGSKPFATVFETGMRPTVTDLQTTNRTLNSADIAYKTSVDATTEIAYGLDRNNLEFTCAFSSSGYGVDHVMSLPCPKQFASAGSPTSLNHTSTYYFKVKGRGTDGEPLDIGAVYDFQTLTMPKIVGAVAMDQDKEAPTTTYRFVWKTNVKTSSVVNYTNDKGRRESKTVPDLTLDHSVTVPNLADQSIYTFEVGGTDENWINVETPFTSQITTPKDSRAPKVTKLTVEVKSSGFGVTQKAQLVVTWETDEPSSSQVEYDLGISGGSYANKSKEDAALSTSHAVILAELEPSKIYHLRAVSKDASGNIGYSEDTTTITGKMQNSVLDIIINSLEKSLGWLFGIFGDR